MNELYISEYAFKIPAVKELDDFEKLFAGQLIIECKQCKYHDQNIGFLCFPDISPDEKFYPQKADIKIMRTDTIAAVISIQNLTEKAKLSENELQNIELWLGSGLHSENILSEDSKLIKYLKKAFLEQDKDKRLLKTYKSIPPLMGLNTLTNATESYAAQYAKIKGAGTIFGTTSKSGFDAVETAFLRMQNNKTQKAIVGASNMSDISGLLSYLQIAKKENIKESIGAAFLLLEKNLSQNSIAKITNIETIPVIPDLQGSAQLPNINSKSENLIISSPFYDIENLVEPWQKVIKLHDFMGYCGGMSIFLLILSAISQININNWQSADCIDIDPFGRIVSLTVTKAK